ncbi:DoxX family protein [Streptomyces sp. NBC_01669]|uniref:DoxX family protein n=1 Tax=Streptomyces sp. NBC_01669 TaxID=2975909 RepID=UPI0022500077|nr:DoxX family protein [Streptomyces sp. NBC_01669]MCX4533856.1 DoxX family protein [Streptomyces sp. NBC_01669]
MLFAFHLTVALLTVALTTMSAVLDFVRYEPVLANMAKAGVPASSLTMLGVLKAAGALELLVGFAVPVIGTSAAIGLALFFVAALGIQQGVCGEPLPAPTLRKELPVVDVHISEPGMRHRQSPKGLSLCGPGKAGTFAYSIGGSWTRRPPSLSR